MIPKVLLLVCLIPLALGGEDYEMMKKMMMYKMMMMGGGDKGGYDKGYDMGDKKDHYAGDGDCSSEKEAMMKKYEMMKKFEMMKKMMEMKEMMEKKKEMEEKMKKFHMYMEMKQKHEEMEAMAQKKKMYEMWQKYEMMKQKKEKEEDFKELIESFTEQKHKFAFKLTHHFLTLCKCGEVNAQMDKMFMGMAKSNDTDLMEDMAANDAMEAWESGDMAGLAAKLKMMSKEQQKKLFMANLIKSMCYGAKTFVMHAKRFEEQYMFNTPTVTPASG